ncbi:MAG TPA: murein transglycosylase A [Alphaproteobacteria bacterium]|nr:murein transglycosylase A [Alphaproteobacteria bacterium]
MSAPVARLSLTPVSYGDLAGWQSDHEARAVPAFVRSCKVILKKPAGARMGIGGAARGWRGPCEALLRNIPKSDVAARAYFEKYFAPYAVAGEDGEEGLFTGYYEAGLRGSWRKTAIYKYPLYAVPKDLVKVDLGLFEPQWKGRHITGKTVKARYGMRLVPYDERAQIARGSLRHRARVLLWVDDPVDAFFLAIQGSGRVRMVEGRSVQVGYAGANGHDYTAVGRVMLAMGVLRRPVTMLDIRMWLEGHPGQARRVMDHDRSYVFFRVLKGGGPVGSEGVALTARRSLAVDPHFVPLGMPLWLVTQTPEGAALQRLMIAEDTGGAIKGAVRGDFYWGAGRRAAAEAGAMQSKGRYYLLLPKGVAVNGG